MSHMISHVNGRKTMVDVKMKVTIVVVLTFSHLFAVLTSINVKAGTGSVFMTVTWDKSTNKYKIQQNAANNWAAKAEFLNQINATGWSYLDVTTNKDLPDDIQAYAAGLVEGYITSDLIKNHWKNSIEGYCKQPFNPYCVKLQKFMKENIDFMNQFIKFMDSKDPDSAYTHQMKLFLLQVDGLRDGYYYDKEPPGGGNTDLDPFGFYFFQISGDLEDLEQKLGKETPSHVFGSGSCSALIKVLPGNKDIYFSHDTWNSYQNMLRILKKYDFSYHLSDKSQDLIPGKVITFSSYPGTVLSGDDFYLISSGLATMETTIGNDNAELLKYITSNTVPEGIRTMISNRLATDGDSWKQIFSGYNSGTYNNQWMVLDYNKFTPGQPIRSGTLTIIEQLPGYLGTGDFSALLENQKYWPSYNIPAIPKVFNMSGGPENVRKYGDWFSYHGSPRAKIFKRDQNKVVDLKSMIKLMRYNDYTNDPLSKCNCTPPYSAENAISARCDLNPANGTYPFQALGHRSHGGTDMKLTNREMFQNLEFVAVSGPTYDQQPPFDWRTADFAWDTPHYGHPDVFKFDPVFFNSTSNVRPFHR